MAVVEVERWWWCVSTAMMVVVVCEYNGNDMDVVEGKPNPLPTYLFNRWPTGAANMQALSVFRHVHDPLRRLVLEMQTQVAAAGKAGGQTRSSAGRRRAWCVFR